MGNHPGNLLEKLPQVATFIGMLDLKTGSIIISALCVAHPMVYGCTLFMPVSYLLLTIWFFLGLFFVTSALLFWALTVNDTVIIAVWLWYSMAFVVIMFLMMLLLGLFFASKRERAKIFFVILGMLWYMLTVYFILVVNSHRKAIETVDMEKPTDGPKPIVDPTPTNDTTPVPTPIHPPSVGPPAVDPLPVDPLPDDPLPADPLPADPVPVDPIPADPIPADPIPADPIAVDPLPDSESPDRRRGLSIMGFSDPRRSNALLKVSRKAS